MRGDSSNPRGTAFLVVLIATISFLAHRAVAQPPEVSPDVPCRMEMATI